MAGPKRGYLHHMKQGPLGALAMTAASLALASPAWAQDAQPQPQPPPGCTPETASAPECQPPADPLPAREVLSVPGQVSRWAFVHRRALARRKPDSGSKTVARLRLRTQDG